jgi:hypothetical protein
VKKVYIIAAIKDTSAASGQSGALTEHVYCFEDFRIGELEDE